MSLATGPLAGISIRNQLPGQVTSIGTGGAMAAVKVSVEGAELTAAITKEAAADSHLEVGSSVMALVKSTEILRSRRLQDERGSEDFVKKV
nr:TOBE domain-containing protein [Saccharopolyspora spinosa]